MSEIGKYILGDQTLIIRNYYDGTLHITLDTPELGRKVFAGVAKQEDGSITAKLNLGKEKVPSRFHISEDGILTGTIGENAVSGKREPITDADDRADAIDRKGKALVMYATMTGNTAKIANCFAEIFRFYGFETEVLRITSKTEVKKDFSDYDIVCLGSSIVAGYPLKIITSKFALGPEANTLTAADGEKREGPGGPPPMSDGPGGMPPMDIPADSPNAITYAGAAEPHNLYHPLGIVFTTYGGGFYGPDEAMATLETLKLYLEVQYVRVVGKFACCGHETGPGGLDDGVLPQLMGPGEIEPPVYYKDGNGNYHAGSYFFHSHMNSKPCDRDLMKARALAEDLVESYFLSYDGKRKEGRSMFLSIS